MDDPKPAPAPAPAAPPQHDPRPARPGGKRTASLPAPLTRAAPAPADHQRGAPPPSRGNRAATFSAASYDAEAHTIEAVFSSGAGVQRYFGLEVLAISPEAVTLDRVGQGVCPFLNAHNQYDIGAVLGRVTAARIEGGQLVGTIQFNQTPAGIAAEGMVARGELTAVSIGYAVRTWQLTESTDASDTWTAQAWELLEVSLVPVPADPNAGVRSADPSPGTATNGDNEEDDDMLTRSAGGAAASTPAAAAVTPPAGDDAARAAAPVTPAPAVTEAAPAGTRAAEPAAAVVAAVGIAAIRQAVTNAGLGDAVAFELLERHEATPLTRDTLLADIGRRFAERDSGARTVGRVSPTVAGPTMRQAMADAVLHRMSPGTQLPEASREFRGMSLLRMAEEGLGATGVHTRGLTPGEIAERALHSTSDFPALMGNALNRRLRASYEENRPSYRMWARQAPNAPDFRNINVVQMSAMPDLLRVNEAGEFRYGTASDGVVTYAVATYGRIIGVTRQVIINDDLRALERITTGFGGAAARLENRTVYAQVTSNPNMPDGVPLFDAKHGNVGVGPIAATSLNAMRTAMRLQKGLQQEELNLMPAHILAPASQEQLAYQFTSSQFVPAKATDVNEFRAGGRTAVDPIVEAVLDGNSTTQWYGVADNAAIDTVEYCYLEGHEGVQISSQIGFDVDGVKLKACLDFAAAVIDYRGLYRSTGQ